MIAVCSPKRLVWIALFVLATGLTRSATATQEVIGDEPPNANAAVVPLLQDLDGDDVTARVAAAMALYEIGPSRRHGVRPQLRDACALGTGRARRGACPRSERVRPLDLRQRLLDVRNDIVGVLDATRITDEAVRDAQFESLWLRNVPE
jgi:hypothetical protein